MQFGMRWARGGPAAWQRFYQRRAGEHRRRQKRNMLDAAQAARAAGSAASRVRTGRLRGSWRIVPAGTGLAVQAIFYSRANPANRAAGNAARAAADRSLRGAGMGRSGVSSIFSP